MMDDFLDIDDITIEDVEEQEVEETKTWWQKFKGFWEKYHSYILPGIFTLGGIWLKDRLDRNQNNATLFTTDETGSVFKVRATRCHTIRPVRVREDKRRDSGFSSEEDED